VISYLLLNYSESLLLLAPGQYFPSDTQYQRTVSQEFVGHCGIRPVNHDSVRICCRPESLTMAVCFGMWPGVFGSHIPPLC